MTDEPEILTRGGWSVSSVDLNTEVGSFIVRYYVLQSFGYR